MLLINRFKDTSIYAEQNDKITDVAQEPNELLASLEIVTTMQGPPKALTSTCHDRPAGLRVGSDRPTRRRQCGQTSAQRRPNGLAVDSGTYEAHHRPSETHNHSK